MSLTPTQIAEISPLLREVHELLQRLINSLQALGYDEDELLILDAHAVNLDAWRMALDPNDDWDDEGVLEMIDHMASLWGPEELTHSNHLSSDGADELAYRKRLMKNADVLFAKFDEALRFPS